MPKAAGVSMMILNEVAIVCMYVCILCVLKEVPLKCLN